MQTYLLLFRADYKAIEKTSPAEIQTRNTSWMAWLDSISAEGKLVGGNHLGNDGRIVFGNGIVENSTFATNGMSVLGYILIQANDYEDAEKIAKACPILGAEENSVEVRALHSM